MTARLALVTGATGYIGGRLVPRLLDAGFRVRVFVRNAEKLKDVPWRNNVDIVEGDLLNLADVQTACRGVECSTTSFTRWASRATLKRKNCGARTTWRLRPTKRR